MKQVALRRCPGMDVKSVKVVRWYCDDCKWPCKRADRFFLKDGGEVCRECYDKVGGYCGCVGSAVCSTCQLENEWRPSERQD